MATEPAEDSAGLSPRRLPIESRSTAGSVARGATVTAGTTGAVIDDVDVVRAVLDGDRDRFRILVERESAAVVRACFRVLGDLHEAEDVAQEAFVSAYRSLATWRRDGPFGAWLTRIAVRLAIRQLGRRRAVGWIRPVVGAAADELVAALPAEPRTQPEHVALNAERASATRRAVASLDEPYREVVALRFFGERSLDEIAALTGRPLGTVKTHLRRGLLRLRDAMDTGVTS
jgi:RNA polymerase sigma-70 factor (ECF subfamily)